MRLGLGSASQGLLLDSGLKTVKLLLHSIFKHWKLQSGCESTERAI